MDPFIAEIRVFPFNYAPKNWAMCNGQILAIAQNTALFSLLGTYYGGDGKTTFALPNLQGNIPLHAGDGPGLSPRALGEKGGENTVTVPATQMPAHTHAISASQGDGGDRSPAGEKVASGVGGISMYAAPGTLTQLSQRTWTPAGGGQPHNNLMPYLTFNFCIALQGVFPPRS